MDVTREMLEDRLEKYEGQLKSLNSYIEELNAMAAKHGTDKAHFEADLHEAEHNVKFYSSEIAQLKKQIGKPYKSTRPGGGADSILPKTVKQGVGSLILSTISFGIGTLLGSRLKSRRSDKDAPK